MDDLLVRLIGWRGPILHGDPLVFDRWRWLKRHLSAGGLRTLDAGCGSGAFLFYAATIGNEGVGISHNKREIEVAQRRARLLGLSGVRFMLGDLRQLQRFRLPDFDQIICFETIEHILDDRRLIRNLADVLKPGGKLLLTTPFKYYRRLVGDQVSVSAEDGRHVRWGYTHQELRELFDECGLDTECEDYVSGLVSQQLTNLMRIFGRIDGRIAWAATFPLRTFQVADVPLTKLVEYPYLSVAVVGVKRNPKSPS